MVKTYSVVLLLIMVFFVPCQCYSQTYSSIISDKEIYSFLNWLTLTEKRHDERPLQIKHIYYKISDWDTANFFISDTALQNQYPNFDIDFRFLFQKRAGTDTMFTKADRAFLFQQYVSIKDTAWHQSFSNSVLVKHKSKIRPSRYYYSIPLFSIDRQYVIIHKVYYCGSLCAYGGNEVYKKVKNGKWGYVTTVGGWMS